MPREPRAPQGPREAGAEARAGAAGWCAVCLRGAARARLLRRRADEFFRTLKIRQSTAWLCSWCLAKIQSFMCLKKKALQSKQWLDSINDSYIFNVNEKYFVEKLKEIQGNNYRCTYFPVISLPHSNSTYVITIPSLDPMTAPPPHHETIRKCWGMSNYKPEQIYSKPASMNITRCWSKPSNQTFDEVASKSTDPDQDSVMRNIEFIKSKNETTCNQKYVKDANGQKINSDKLIDKNINITSKEYVENAIKKLFDQCSFSDMPADKNSLNSGVKVGSCFSISKGMCDEQKSSNTRLAPGSNDYVTNENIDIIIPNIFENQGIKTNFTPTDDEECGDSDITVAQQNSANTIVIMSEKVHTSNITQNYSKTSGRWDKISSTNLQESKTYCIPTVIVKEECNDYDLELNDNKIGFRNLLPEVKAEKSKEDYIDDEDTWDAWSELGIEAVQLGLEKQENTSTSYEKTRANHNSHKDTKCFMQEHFLPNKICKRKLYETGHYTSEVLPYNESISDSQDDDCDDLLVERILPYTNCIRKSLRCLSIQNIKQKQKIKQNEITADSIINEQNFFRVDSLDNSNGQKKRMVQHKTHAKNQQRTRILKKQKIRKKHDKKLAESISELHQKEGKKNLRVMVTPIKFESSLQARILRSRACLEKEQTETEKKNTPESCEDIDKIKCRNTTNVVLKNIYVEQILPKQNCTSNTACDDIETENQSELSERNEKDKKISTNGFQGECASLQGVALPINKIIVNDIVIQSNKKTKATKSGATLIISDNRTGRFCTSRGPYQCDFCEKLFTSKREVRMHLRRKHLTTCNQQQLQNKEKNSYTDDSQVVGGNTSIEQIVPNRNFLASNEVECEETKKSLELCIILEKKKEKLGDEELSSLTTKQNKKPNELIKSIEKKKCKNCHITHTGRGPFICNVCNKVFTCKKYFQKHKRNMHAMLVDASKNDIKKRIGTKGTDKFQSRDKTIRKKQIVEPYQCTVCMRIFKCRMYLTRHVSRLHSNDNKRYKCNICDSKFHQKWEIARHIVRTHGKKDCARCSLKFRSKADLQKHYDCAHKNDTEHTPQDSKSHSQLPLAKKQYPVPGVRGEI